MIDAGLSQMQTIIKEMKSISNTLTSITKGVGMQYSAHSISAIADRCNTLSNRIRENYEIDKANKP